jgi:Domain of unknown function (DUF397)
MTEWRKSSFSDVNTNCVEIAWHKSKFSGGNTDCVEVAPTSASVGVRDSKNPEPRLVLPNASWRAFVISL